ncbi:MAG: hypothetical protein ACI37T_06110 [Candidatus Gastranaerophilaceae bacterium]
MLNLKNLKVVKEIKSIQPKLKWMMFSEMEDYKVNSEYLDLICGNKDNNVEATELYLDKMVRDSLVKEFSADIKNTASFDLLADMVLYNLKKKQLEEMDEQEA